MQPHVRLKALAAAIAMLGSASSMAAATTAVAPMAEVSQAMAMRPGDVLTSAVSAQQPVHVEVALKLRNQDQLNAFIATARSPSPLIVQRAMTPDQFKAEHSPTEAQAKAVAAYLIRAGFHNVKIAPNRLLVSADGSADVAKAAFNTTLANFRTATGTTGFANTSAVQVPSAIRASVLSVVGLQTLHRPHTMLQAAPAAFSPQAVTGHNPTEFSSIYGGSGQQTGAGVKVGILTQGNISQTIQDLNTFTSNNGLSRVSTSTVNVNGTSSDTSGLGEWALDSQDIVGAAGGQIGGIVFYNVPTLSNANLTAGINRVVSDNAVKIINVSLGECETYTQQDGSAAADDQAFQQAVAQGQTFSVSSGDSGADECGNGGVTPSYPASSPFVVSVGGTRLNTSGTSYTSETVWNDLSGGGGATGGSSSLFESQPSWQNGVAPGNKRGVPDIAYDASPSSGALVTVNGSTQQIGGTSLAAPIFSGIWARVLAAKGSSVGFAAPLLYQLPAGDFHDVTSGNNGGENAGSGYDLTTGRGSAIISRLLADVGNGGGGGGGNNNVLQNGQAVSGLGASRGKQLSYSVNIPAGARNLRIATSGGTGDVDLYVKIGSPATTSNYDCRPYQNGNNEACTASSASAGTYYILLNGYSTFSGVTLKASWN